MEQLCSELLGQVGCGYSTNSFCLDILAHQNDSGEAVASDTIAMHGTLVIEEEIVDTLLKEIPQTSNDAMQFCPSRRISPHHFLRWPRQWLAPSFGDLHWLAYGGSLVAKKIAIPLRI